MQAYLRMVFNHLCRACITQPGAAFEVKLQQRRHLQERAMQRSPSSITNGGVETTLQLL